MTEPSIACVSKMDMAISVEYYYPKSIHLHYTSREKNGVPFQITFTIEKARDGAVFLIENGIDMLMIIGLATDPA